MKALCFDYLLLKETFGLDLETKVVAEVQGTQVEVMTEMQYTFKQNELDFT